MGVRRTERSHNSALKIPQRRKIIAFSYISQRCHLFVQFSESPYHYIMQVALPNYEQIVKDNGYAPAVRHVLNALKLEPGMSQQFRIEGKFAYRALPAGMTDGVLTVHRESSDTPLGDSRFRLAISAFCGMTRESTVLIPVAANGHRSMIPSEGVGYSCYTCLDENMRPGTGAVLQWNFNQTGRVKVLPAPERSVSLLNGTSVGSLISSLQEYSCIGGPQPLLILGTGVSHFIEQVESLLSLRSRSELSTLEAIGVHR